MTISFNLPENNNSTSIYYTNGSTSWQTWLKPKDCKYITFYVIGGGGGGGGGSSGLSTTAHTGGGSGASSSISYATYPSFSIPETVYIQVGSGGAGGAGAGSVAANGSPGNSGAVSYVSIAPNTNTLNVLLASGIAAAGGGPAGSANAVLQTAASGGTAISISTYILTRMGFVNSTAGQNGTISNATTNVTGVTITKPVSCGGAGGGSSTGGSAFTGGSILAFSFFSAVSSGTAQGTSGGSGLTFLPNNNVNYPMIFTGGAGGVASVTTSVPGGNGGAGSFGCGGGGGGSGINSVTSGGGTGGRGGDGIVIITAW